MAHLQTIAFEKPEYAGDCGIEDIKWIDIKGTLKVMWRKQRKKCPKVKFTISQFSCTHLDSF